MNSKAMTNFDEELKRQYIASCHPLYKTLLTPITYDPLHPLTLSFSVMVTVCQSPTP